MKHTLSTIAIDNNILKSIFSGQISVVNWWLKYVSHYSCDAVLNVAAWHGHSSNCRTAIILADTIDRLAVGFLCYHSNANCVAGVVSFHKS